MTPPESSTETLILSGSGYDLQIAPSAIAQKERLIKHSGLILEVTDAPSSDAARAQIKLLGAMRNLVESSRNKVKAPVLKVGKDIDAKASDFAAEITAEENRLKKLQGDYAILVQLERNRVLAEIRAKEEAEAKAAREAEAKRVAEAAVADRARREAEEAQWNAVTPEQEAAAKAKAEEAAKAEAARVAAAQAEAERVAALPVAPVFVPEAPKGVKMMPDYEVTDIDALYKHNVGLVTLTERRAEILDSIKRQIIGDTLPTIPGLRVFLKPSVSTR